MTFEAVTARPDGESTVARMATTAAEYGYDGVVVRNAGTDPAEYDRSAIAAEYDVDVVDGVEIVTDDPSRASGFLGRYRPDRTILAIRGGTQALNRFAVEQPAVDVLAGPLGIETDDDTVDVDHVLAKSAAENGVRIEFSFAPILRRTGGSRVRAIRSLKTLWELVQAYDAPYLVTAGADSHLTLRSPRELAALGDVVGFTTDDVLAGLEEWANVTRRNRDRRSDEVLEPGVRLENDE